MYKRQAQVRPEPLEHQPAVHDRRLPPFLRGLQAKEKLLPVSYTHLRAHETVLDLVCRLLLEKKKYKPTQILKTSFDTSLTTYN